jgi:pimeloyl-ACP methyl ester carboxylesterase
VLSGDPEVAVTIQPAPPAPADGAAGSDTDWGVHAEGLWRGQRCHWRALGDAAAPALVLVHGFAAGSGHWRRNAAVLAAAGWRVVVAEPHARHLCGASNSVTRSVRMPAPADGKRAYLQGLADAVRKHGADPHQQQTGDGQQGPSGRDQNPRGASLATWTWV